MTVTDPRRPDWWSTLYDPAHGDTLAAADQSGQPDPDSPDDSPRWWERRPGGSHIPGGARLPNWRKGQTTDLSSDSPDADAEPSATDAETAPEVSDAVPDVVDVYDDIEPDDEDAIETVPVRVRRWRPVNRGWQLAQHSAGGLTPRVIAFNGTAAGAGYLLGVEPLLGRVLPVAQQLPAGMLGLGLSAVGAVTAWKISGCRHIEAILPAPPISRLLLSVGAAELGARFAPVPVMWLAQYGTPWGVGPSAVSYLLTAAGMCGGLWWLTVPRSRFWWWPLRWIARIPVASALLAVAVPGLTH